MKRHLLATLVVVLAPLSAFAQGTQVLHQNVNGTTLSAFSFDTVGRSVQLFRNTANGVDSPQYTILYSVGSCDGGYPINTCDGQEGSGILPGGAVQVGAQTAHVRVDTSAVSGFVADTFHEVIDFSAGYPVITLTYTFTPGLVVDLSWRATNQFQSSSSGNTQQSTFGTTLSVGAGTQSFTTAAVEGTLGGVQMTGATGTIGTIHSSSVTITKR